MWWEAGIWTYGTVLGCTHRLLLGVGPCRIPSIPERLRDPGQRLWDEPGLLMPKAKSKAQARFFGAVAGGRIRKKGLSKKEARTRLRGVKMSKLPRRKRRKGRRRKRR